MDMLRERLGDEARRSVGIDWLAEVALDPAIDDNLWLSRRHFGLDDPESVELRFYPYAIGPPGFVRGVLPVTTDTTYWRADLVLQDVDSSLVIGGTYRRYPEIGKGELERLNASVRDHGREWTEAAIYLQVGALPLYFGSEGKNRVRAFLKAQMNIAAFVASIPFPDAETLSLHKVDNSSITCIYNPSSGKYAVLVLPSIAVPLLESYGVQWGRRLSFPVEELNHIQRESLIHLTGYPMLP